MADAWISRIPHGTLAGIRAQPCYDVLLNPPGSAHVSSAAGFHAAWYNAHATHIGWVVVGPASPAIARMLRRTGFSFAYRADGASVYRPAAGVRPAAP